MLITKLGPKMPQFRKKSISLGGVNVSTTWTTSRSKFKATSALNFIGVDICEIPQYIIRKNKKDRIHA
jgi:hypothetical protein